MRALPYLWLIALLATRAAAAYGLAARLSGAGFRPAASRAASTTLRRLAAAPYSCAATSLPTRRRPAAGVAVRSAR